MRFVLILNYKHVRTAGFRVQGRGAFRHFRDKNIVQSAMTLIAERLTPRFFKTNPIKISKSEPGALYSVIERSAD
jgi:hypothetical protein